MNMPSAVCMNAVVPCHSTVDVSSNQLQGTLPSDLSALRSIVTFDASQNALINGSIPSTLTTMTQLAYVAFHGC